MGYILNKDQWDIVNLAKDYAEKKVMPLVPELDNAPELKKAKNFLNSTKALLTSA